MRKGLWIAAAAVAALALAGAGCGSDNDGDSAASEALAEIGEVRSLLEQAGGQYADGDAEAAEETVGDAYLEHFEEVEEPLEEENEELMEELEVLISTTIRDRIKAGAPAAEVEGLIAEAQQKLDDAENALRSATA